MRKFLASLLVFLALSAAAHANCIGTLPNNLTNGTTADASQVMADFNFIVNQTNANCATAGANSNITAITGLTTPLSAGQGGTQLYTAGTSTGSANAQVVASGITPTGFALVGKPEICFLPGFTNTSATTLNVNTTGITNVFKRTGGGAVALAGGELVSGQLACVQYDGTEYVIDTAFAISGAPNGTLAFTGTGTITAAQNGSYVALNTNTGFTVTLPSPALVNGQPEYFIVNNTVSGTNTLSTPSGVFSGPGTSGASTQTLAATTLYVVVSDGTNYWIQTLFRVGGVPQMTVQRLLSGSGATYTPPAGITRVIVRMCGGGGGGGSGSSAGGTGGTGGTTTFASWTGIGGSGGGVPAGANSGGAGGTGGAAGSGVLIDRRAGNAGNSWSSINSAGQESASGAGGGCPYFGGGGGGLVGTQTGAAGTTNSGGGGSGGSNSGTGNTGGSGGGSGEYVEFTMTAAQVGASQLYTVGTSGAGGTTASVGGAGGTGIIIVQEFYY